MVYGIKIGGFLMLDAILSSPRANVLQQAISASSLRQKVISNNIANVNTPGYKKSEVVFEDLLQSAISGDKLPLVKTNARHLPIQKAADIPAATIQVDDTTSIRPDGSNVDIDVEMASLAKNSIYYNAVVQQMGSYFTTLKSAIREGK